MSLVRSFDVFLSYSHADAAGAQEVDAWLRAQEVRAFYDRRELRVGLPWLPALEDAIDSSGAVAILTGAHGIGNTQHYEVQAALIRQSRERGFPVIPVLLPGCEVPPTGFLELQTWVDLRAPGGIQQRPEGLQSLLAAIRGQAVDAAEVRGAICPYRGLEPFREEDAAFFCGREAVARELAGAVREQRFVAVVGRSGSGKSSLVFAGLLPALRQQSAGTMWDVLTLRPGARPLHALAAAFNPAPVGSGVFVAQDWQDREAAALRAGPADRLAAAIAARLDGAPERPDQLLLYVDQWEELYAMAPAKGSPEAAQHATDVDRFIALLLAATEGAQARARVVLTIRADFYGPLIGQPRVSHLFPAQQVNIPPMAAEDIRAAIMAPAGKVGLTFDPPALVGQIQEEVGTDEGRLPLLQYALKETWSHREGTRLTADSYLQSGRVSGAIQTTAKNLYEGLTQGERTAARRLFLGLVTPGEGREDTRARIAMPTDGAILGVLGKFAGPQARLLVTGSEPVTHGADAGGIRGTVEVAHEALIRTWGTLRSWLDENREKLRARAFVQQKQRQWEENGQRDDLLLQRGFELERGRDLLDDPGDVPVNDLRDFVGRSARSEDARLAAERDAALAVERREKELAERAAARVRNWFRGAALAAIVALVGLAGAGWEWNAARSFNTQLTGSLAELTKTNTELTQSKGAERKAAEAANAQRVAAEQATRTAIEQRDRAQAQESRALAILAQQASREGNQPTAMLLALEALPDPGFGGARPWSSDAAAALNQAWLRNRETALAGHQGGVTSASFSADGTHVVTASADNTARVWDLRGERPSFVPLEGHQGGVTSASFSADGTHVVTASGDRTGRVWDLRGERPSFVPLEGHQGGVTSASFSADGTHVVTASWDKTARVWDLRGERPAFVPLDGHQNWVSSASFSADGTHVVTASWDDTARVWDLRGERPSFVTLEGHRGPVESVSFSGDGTHVVTASSDKTARVWDLRGERPTFVALEGHQYPVFSASFSADGTHVVTASKDKTARVWDLRGERPIFAALEGHQGAVTSASFSADGTHVVTASDDKTARVWRVFADVNTLIGIVRPRLSRCLSQAEREGFGLASAQPTSEDRNFIPPPGPDGRCPG